MAINGVRVFTNSAVVEAPHLEIAKSEDLIKSKILLVKAKILLLYYFSYKTQLVNFFAV